MSEDLVSWLRRALRDDERTVLAQLAEQESKPERAISIGKMATFHGLEAADLIAWRETGWELTPKGRIAAMYLSQAGEPTP